MRPSARIAALVVVTALGVAACSSSSGSDATSTSTTRAPEDVIVSNAEAAAGLATLREIVGKAKTDAAAPNIGSVADDAWEHWEKIEGRVKANDTGAYLEFEDALSDLRTGAKNDDTAKVQRGATTIDGLITKYLAQHPA
jgi:hypothetical protein